MLKPLTSKPSSPLAQGSPIELGAVSIVTPVLALTVCLRSPKRPRPGHLALKASSKVLPSSQPLAPPPTPHQPVMTSQTGMLDHLGEVILEAAVVRVAGSGISGKCSSFEGCA